jgi:hypothetical protein
MTPTRARVRRLGAGHEQGMTTAEYAVGTVAACGFGGLLYKILTSPEVATMIRNLIERALSIAF